MPVHTGYDKYGYFFQWGTHGKRYYFNNRKSEEDAKKKALAQARAAYSRGYHSS